jgi:uridine kinase
MHHPFFVGVTGGSGSGKTYFLTRLVEALGKENVTLVSQDNYYRDRSLQPVDENGITNFDTPDSIDHEQFVHDIQELRAGNEVHKLEYTFNNPAAKPKDLIFRPNPIIIVEGIFVMYYSELVRQLDLKLFIDARTHIKIRRRIQRDRIERGYDLEDVLYRYENHVMPSYERYIHPHKRDADLIINNDTRFDSGLEVVVAFLKSKIMANKR